VLGEVRSRGEQEPRAHVAQHVGEPGVQHQIRVVEVRMADGHRARDEPDEGQRRDVSNVLRGRLPARSQPGAQQDAAGSEHGRGLGQTRE
jgi:hypothetical protein